jgi:hypothetical protein
MQVEERNGAAERRILIECIINKDFLARLAAVPGEPLRSRWANLLLTWCRAYYADYAKAPGREIETLYADWAVRGADRSSATAIERLLTGLSDEYRSRESSPGDLAFLLSLAQAHLNAVALDRLRERLRDAVDRDDVDAGLREYKAFQPVDLTGPVSINLLTDVEGRRRALSQQQKLLIRYPGAAGSFFGEELAEGCFVGVLGRPKGGKSFTLLDFGWRAFLQGRGVGYFQVGDLTRDQMWRRFHRRVAYRPLGGGKTAYYPKAIALSGEDYRKLAVVDSEPRYFERPLSVAQLDAAYERAARRSKGRLEVSYHPTRTITAQGVREKIIRWREQGFSPQVVVVDYAGNLDTGDRKLDYVRGTEQSWAVLRQISEEFNLLLFAGQQSNAAGIRVWCLTANNWSDSRLILAHVTAFMGVNTTDEEKKSGVIRYNWLLSREGTLSDTDCLYCGRNYDAADPVAVATMADY